ncbi:11056_t:CDS:2 [Scutellospora calospora]|uniref:11056_t:CDS:1 n=1 Tax=Scutellospora calospora TaxID=85575 RepID=A0ACA9KQ81_9GLOM|nr:11056_t:CDS:2 [Scutellospora calospora]
MANRGQPTFNTNSQRTHHNPNMFIQPQQAQARDKLQQNNFDEKRHKKVVSHRRKPMENEKDKQKAEYETSRNELKSLLAQFGSKAKAADDLDKDVSKLHSNIENLLEKVQGKANKLPQSPSTVIEQRHTNKFLKIWKDFISYVFFPFKLLLSVIRRLYCGINCTIILMIILLIECFVIFLIWTIKRSHHAYLYVEPYEPIVHGTYDIDQTESWKLLRTITDLILNFFSEILNGGRGFGSPNYDGSVPI